MHSCDEFNIKLSRVILGLNCSPEHQERIEKCVEKINKARYEKYIKGFDVSEYDKLRYLFNFNNENVKIAKIESDDNLHLIANDYICKY